MTYRSFDKGLNVKSICFNISKEFDKLWHYGIIFIDGILLNFMCGFLKEKNELQIRWLLVTEVACCKDLLLIIVNFALSRCRYCFLFIAEIQKMASSENLENETLTHFLFNVNQHFYNILSPETCARLFFILLQYLLASDRPHRVHKKNMYSKNVVQYSYYLKLNNIIDQKLYLKIMLSRNLLSFLL